MGCSASLVAPASSAAPFLVKRSSKVTIDSMASETAANVMPVKQRYGHPAYYKADGYDVGLRFRVKSNLQSFFVGTARLNGDKVTIKEHHIENCNEEEITNEIMILSKLSHECIPKLSEIFITNISCFMITDFIDALRIRHYIDFRSKSTTLTSNDVRSIIKSVLSAVSHCHSQGVIVRNLTADNIMVKKVAEGCYDTKIADFSQAVAVGCTKSYCEHSLFEWNDVPYMAPESLLGLPYGTAMDMWSIGVLLYLMLSGELPFDSPNDNELVVKIKFASYTFDHRKMFWATIHEKAKYLIGQLLMADPKVRPDAKTVMKNVWLVVG